MAIFTRNGHSHSTTLGGTGLSIDKTDLGSILIGDGQGFTLGTLVAGVGVSLVSGDGTITITGTPPYSLPQASSSVLGGIKVGSGLTINVEGTLSRALLVPGDIPDLDTSKLTTGLLSAARGGTGLNTSGAANGTLLIGTGSGLGLSTLTAGSGVTITNGSGTISISATGSGGTVTDVDVYFPVEFNVSGGPVTSSGVITAWWANQSAHTFLGAPVGGTGTPGFRTLQAADIPPNPLALLWASKNYT